MGILDVPSYSKTQSDSIFARKNRIRAAVISGNFAGGTTKGIPAVTSVTADIPTITSSGAVTISSYKKISLFSSNIRLVSPGSSYDSTNVRFSTPLATTMEFVLIGTTLEIQWIAAGATSTDSFWIWVDGKPTTTAPASTGFTTSLGTLVFTKLVFGDSGPRTITIHSNAVNSLQAVIVPITSSVTEPNKKLRGLFIGDSFMAGITSPVITPFEYQAYQVSRLLGCEASVYAQGGTGYVAAITFTTPFGSSARTSYATAYNPDFIVISGSVNDDGSSGIGAAVTAAINAFATACPNVPIIVFGPQPNSATGTLSSNRQSNNNAVITAALANSNVIATYDQIGHGASSVSAWSSATTYSTGSLVSYIGSIWRWDRTTSASNVTPGGTNSNAWSLVTYLFTGTGKVGSTTGDGTRDLLLLADAVHPSLNGATALSFKMASDIKLALLTYAFS